VNECCFEKWMGGERLRDVMCSEEKKGKGDIGREVHDKLRKQAGAERKRGEDGGRICVEQLRNQISNWWKKGRRAESVSSGKGKKKTRKQRAAGRMNARKATILHKIWIGRGPGG